MKSISIYLFATLILFCFNSCNISKILKKTNYTDKSLVELNKCPMEYICKKIDSVKSNKVNYVLFAHYGGRWSTYYLFTQNSKGRYTVYKVNPHQSLIFTNSFSDSFAKSLIDTANMIKSYNEKSICLNEIELYQSEYQLKEFFIYNYEHYLEIKIDNYFTKYSFNIFSLSDKTTSLIKREQIQRVLREILTLHCCVPEVNNLEICD
jgi:hypothetical protein